MVHPPPEKNTDRGCRETAESIDQEAAAATPSPIPFQDDQDLESPRGKTHVP